MSISPKPFQRLLVDTDTAGDDTMALLAAALSDRAVLEGVTIVAGNVEFEREVENAKYTLSLAGQAQTVPVFEGARSPLLKDYTTAEHIHGEGGLGGVLFPETGIPSSDQDAVDFIIEAARRSPGELTLACIGPLTNIALALKREPKLNALLKEVWVMGGAVATVGNVTPAAEYNFWVDPDAAKLVMRELDVTLLDWGLTLRDATLTEEELATVENSTVNSQLAEFFTQIAGPQRSSRQDGGIGNTAQPDSMTVLTLLEPALIKKAGNYFIDVDEREGLTRGYSSIDKMGVTGGYPRTRVIESIDHEMFRTLFTNMLLTGNPHWTSDEKG
jgi:purine nucleosidase